jgi:hypothetical protein
MQLNYGPFERAGSKVAIEKTRLQFLWNARHRIPKITQDLFDTCYPLYRAFRETAPSWSAGWQQVRASKQAVELDSRLDEWSKEHLLIADWCIERAIGAMKAWESDAESLKTRSWCKHPDIARYLLFPHFYPNINFDIEHLRELRWMAHQAGILPFGPDEEMDLLITIDRDRRICVEDINLKEGPEPSLGYPRWCFTAVSKEEYLQDVEREARERIDRDGLLSTPSPSYKNNYAQEVKRRAVRYCDAVEKHISNRSDWKKSQVFSSYRSHLKRVIWTVMFQLEGKSYSEIADIELPCPC